MGKNIYGVVSPSKVELPEFELIANNRYAFFAKARLDNRDDLIAALKLESQTQDNSIVAHAFLKWGKQVVNMLCGDWYLIVFDYHERELWIARDQLGYTAIYYTFIGQQIHFSNVINILLDRFHPVLNEKALICKLTLSRELIDQPHTDFEGVYPLEGGTELIFKNGTVKINRYWNPEETTVRKYSKAEDYTEELFELFLKAVKSRIPANGLVTSMLSGGLDSGAVASLAAKVLGDQGKSLTTFSHVPLYRELLEPETQFTFFDETDRIYDTANFYPNIQPVLLNSVGITPIQGIKEYLKVNEQLIHGASNAYWMVDLYHATKTKGGTVLLTGEHGNIGLSNQGVINEMSFTHPYFLRSPTRLIKKLLKPVSRGVKDMLTDPIKLIEYRLDQGFVSSTIRKKYKLEEKKNLKFYDDACYSGESLNSRMSHLLKLNRHVRCFNGANVKSHFGVELRDPTADKRVIEYCFSIPNEFFFDKNGVGRNIMRKMMNGLMSPATLMEQKKGKQSSDIVARLLASSHEVDDTLYNLIRNEYFQYLFDAKSLVNYWNQLKTQKIGQPVNNRPNNFLKAIMTGLLIERNNF